MNARRVFPWVAGICTAAALAVWAVLTVAAAPAAGPTAPPPAPAGLATATPTVACTPDYTYTVGISSVITGTDLVAGSQCAGCVVPLALPFPVTFYGQTYTSAELSTEGNLQFATSTNILESCPPPYPALGPAMLPYWYDGIDLSWNEPCLLVFGLPCGIFTRLTGTAPNRTLYVEWRGRQAGSNHEVLDYEVRLHEGSETFEFVYGGGVMFGYSTSIGVQDGAGQYTSYVCDVVGNYQGVMLTWNPEPSGPCATATATPPTPTPTSRPPSATPTLPPVTCTPDYTYTISTGNVITATDLVAGSQCGQCVVPLALPFPVTFYGQAYTSAAVSTNGNLQFASAVSTPESCPPPYPALGPALLPYWFDGIDTSESQFCTYVYGLPCGIFTRVSGTAPNRVLNIEWRAMLLGSNHEGFDYEVRLHEDSPSFEFVYGAGVQFGYSTAIGVQDGAGRYTSYICDVVGNYQDMMLSWSPTCGGPATATPTPTSTAPSPTPTLPLPSPTLTVTPITCTLDYTYTISSGTVVTATDLVAGSQCGQCVVPLALPFPVMFYGQTYTAAAVSTNGNVQFASAVSTPESCPPPYPALGPAMLPYWFDGMDTSRPDFCTPAYGLPCGIFTLVSGTAPHRVLHLEWRASLGGSNHEAIEYEVRLHEDSPSFEFVYGFGFEEGFFTSIGVQDGTGHYTSYICDVVGNYVYVVLTWSPAPGPCATATPPPSSPTPTSTPPAPSATSTAPPGASTTPLPSATGTPAPPASATPAPPSTTATPPPTASATPGATETPCGAAFSDVHPTDYFYGPVLYLACHGVISGYADGTFRPYTPTTRAQMVKIVVLGFGIPLIPPPPDAYTFADVPPAHPFFGVIETAAAHGIVSGYTCGGPGEPCDPQNRPYFRPYANVTRGQLSKITVIAAGWDLQNPPAGTFADVLPNTAFYPFVETAAAHGIISGYDCGGPGEPCDPQHRPYFRQGADATRGQIAKIVYLAITSGLAPRP